MQKSESSFGFDYWGASVFPETTNKTASYTFTVANGPVTKTVGPFNASLVPKFATPDWAKHVVWYQIFPEPPSC